MANFFEIVELTNGDVALRRADGDDGEEQAEIVKIQFSQDAKDGLNSHHLEIAHAMIEAGVRKVGEISGLEVEHSDFPEMPEGNRSVH